LAVTSNRKIERFIYIIAHDFWHQRDIQSRITLSECTRIASRCVVDFFFEMEGRELEECEVGILKASLKNRIKKGLDLFHEFKLCFGCSLIKCNRESFDITIGPVHFGKKALFIEELRKRNLLKDSFILSNGLVTYRIGAENERPSGSIERFIVSECENVDWVCSVDINRLSHETALNVAPVAANLALLCLAMRTGDPLDTLRYFHINYTDSPLKSEYLLIDHSNEVGWGGSWNLLNGGLSMNPDEWEDDFRNYTKFYDVFQVICRYFLGEVEQKNSHYDEISRLAHACLWFLMGCREKISQMSIVYYVSSIDCLCNSQTGAGVWENVRESLGWSDVTQIGVPKKSAKSTVINLYKDWRSRTLHGNNKKLLHDSQMIRTQAYFISFRFLVIAQGVGQAGRIGWRARARSMA